MSQIARRHHYLPQSYLAAFTDSGLKTGKLYVFDVSDGTQFHASPKKVAVRRDFNRIDLENLAPDTLENAWSPFEERCVAAIQNVIRAVQFPDDIDDYIAILNLLCLIAIRNPRRRRLFNQSYERGIRETAKILVSDKQLWERFLKKARTAGEFPHANVSFEQIKGFIEGDRYRIDVLPIVNLDAEVHGFDELLPILFQRKWSVLVAPMPGPHFICCDHPVVLARKDPGSHGPIGYNRQNTEVLFPLGPRIGFYGVYEDPLPSVVEIKPADIANINRWVKQNAERHVFSPTSTLFL